MAAPVWILSVDLQTKSATFTTGLADAAKAARGSFNDIKNGSREMGDAVGYSTMEARHSVMMLGEEFGVHLPRSLTTFIAGLGPIGPALEAAFPFLAVILGATLLIEHLVKLHEAGEKLTDDQMKFGTAVNNAFNQLDQKLTQAEIKSDELKNDHLGALKLQLESIDKQSMDELSHSFEEVAKTADAVMKDLEGHWYTFGVGSDDAKKELDIFHTKYQNLLSLHTDAGKDEAHNLLTGTLKTAQEVLKAQQTIKANRDSGEGMTDDSAAAERTLAIHRVSLTVTNSEVQARQAIVTALQKQVGLEGESAAIQKTDADNAKTTAAKAASSQASSGARGAAESQVRMGQQAIAGDRATAEAQLTIKRASIEERLTLDLDFAQREADLQQAGNAAQIAALDKMAPGYTNALKGLNDKSLEIANEYATKVAELKAHASIEENNRDLTALRQSEAEKIEATRAGSSARMAAINAAIAEEESKNLQDTNYFRDLMKQRVDVARQAAEEEGKVRAEEAKEDAEAGEKAGMQGMAALKLRYALENSIRTASVAQRIAQETNIADQEYAIKMVALQKEINGLDKAGKDYNTKLKQLLDQQKQLIQQNALDVATIRANSQIQTDNALTAAYGRFTDTISSDLTKVIMGHETMAHMLQSLGESMISSMVENTIKYIMLNNSKQASDARAAAGSAYDWGTNIGGPILGAISGAAAFAGVMAFEEGGVVPGVGRGDIVPAMLTPGEGIVPKSVMGQLSDLAKSGALQGGGNHYHYHLHTRIQMSAQALDGDGVDTVFEKHADKIQGHFERALRKIGR